MRRFTCRRADEPQKMVEVSVIAPYLITSGDFYVNLKHIKPLDYYDSWWLRKTVDSSSSFSSYGLVTKGTKQGLQDKGDESGLRPAVICRSNLSPGDSVILWGRIFTALTSRLLLCDSIVVWTEYSEHGEKYENSKVKRVLGNWFKEKMEDGRKDDNK